MRTIELLTQDGCFVARIEMPPFNPLPQVVFWSSRVFVLPGDAPTVYHDLVPIYHETFAWYAPLEPEHEMIDPEVPDNDA